MNELNLRSVAAAQRWQIIALLFVVVAFCLYGLSDPIYEILPPFMTPSRMDKIAWTSVVALWIASLTLAWRLYNGASLVVVWFLCTMVPINLIAWLVINSHATKVLRAAGAKVGFFGAKLS